MTTPSDARAAAHDALGRGLSPIPVPAGRKNPGFRKWQEFRATPETVDQTFPPDSNIGLLLGGPSGNLLDVDLDCAEALRLADHFLPQTGLVHGRPSKPASHRFYRCDEPGAIEQFKDPATKAMLVELRGQGGQTVIPPSLHPDGERLAWVSYGDPSSLKLTDLRRAVRRLAAACLLVLSYPEHNRHEFTLALAGFLIRGGLDPDVVEKLLLAVAEAVGPGASRPDDLAHIRRNVRDTFSKLSADRPAVGGKALRGYLDPRVISKLREWLLDGGAGPGGDGQPAPHPEPSSAVNERVDDPHRVARLVLEKAFGHPDRPTLLFWRDEAYSWCGTRWDVLPEAALRGTIAQVTKAFFDEENVEAVREWESNGGLDPETGKRVRKPTCKPVTVALTGNVRQALSGIVLVPDTVEPPAWLEDGRGNPPAADLVAFENALVHLPSLAAGKQKFSLRHTPLLFSLHSMSFAFDPNAPQPEAWLTFLGELWPDDPESIRELMKWFGSCLTADTSQQKILMLIGPPRSGKGTIARVVRFLVGPANVAGPTLSSFATNFGLWALLGKRLAVISDARITGRTDAAPVIERLLSISGEDVLTVDRKNLPPVSTKLDTRLMLLSNELPRLGDSSAALASRMVILGLSRSWLGKEDPGLTAKLQAELPGILLHFALPGWNALQEDGAFLQPGSGAELVEELESLSSPILTFVQERCVEDPDASIEVQALFAEWLRWCDQMHRDKPGDCQTFGRNLRAALPHLRVDRPRRGEDRVRVYEGIRLRRPGEPWSAMVRGLFNSTRGRDHRDLSPDTRVRDAIGGTADHRGPEPGEGDRHACVGCGVGVSPDALLCPECWAKHPHRKDQES